MPIVRPCIGKDCKENAIGGSRCKRHQREHEEETIALHPWEALYDTVEWQRARDGVKQRDSYRCTMKVGERRCAATEMDGMVSVHHTKKVQAIWIKHGRPKIGSYRWKLFVKDATNPEILVTLCSRHHEEADTKIVAQTQRPDLSSSRRNARHARRRDTRAVKGHKRDQRKEWL